MGDSNDRPDSGTIEKPTEVRRVPRELLLGAMMLVAILVAMGAALWFAASHSNLEQNRLTGDAVPTAQLLDDLSTALGESASVDDVRRAMIDWLDGRTGSDPRHDLALVASGPATHG